MQSRSQRSFDRMDRKFLVLSARSAIEVKPAPFDCPFEFELWRPRLRQVTPPGEKGPRFIFWWLMHLSYWFGNRDYSALIVRHLEVVVHRSMVFPPYFRFPFMSAEDLQIGDTATEIQYRGKGLASLAINQIIRLHEKKGRTFWYIVAENNVASIGAAEKAGLEVVGTAIRRGRFGIRAIGNFEFSPLETAGAR